MKVDIFNKPLGGFANQDGTNVPVEGAKDEYSRADIIDLFRPGFVGDIAPGEICVDLAGSTTYVNDLPLNFTIDSNGKKYAILRNARIVEFNTSDVVSSATDIVGSSTVSVDSNDLITYRSSTGTEYILASWESSTGSDIARVGLELATVEKTWFSNLTSSGTLTVDTTSHRIPHRLWLGPDKVVYCTNGQYLASHDPSTAVGNAQALNLGTGNISIGGAPWNIYSAVVGHKQSSYFTGFARNECTLWLWNGYAPDPNLVIPIEDNFATAIKNDNGVLKIFTYGRNNKMRVWQYAGGTQCQLIKEVDIGFAGNGPLHGSVEVWRDMTVWGMGEGAGDAQIAGLIPVDKGRYGFHRILHPWASNTTVTVSGSTLPNAYGVNAIGGVKNLLTGVLYAGVQSVNTFRIVKSDITTYYPATSLIASRLIRLDKLSNIVKVYLTLSQTGTGGSFKLALYKDYNGFSFGGVNDLLNRQITNAAYGNQLHIQFPVFIGRVQNFYMGIQFDHASSSNTAAIVKYLGVEVEPADYP